MSYRINDDVINWQGAGWYAPRTEGRGDFQTTFYYHVDDDPDSCPDTYGECLGTPTWFETEDEFYDYD